MAKGTEGYALRTIACAGCNVSFTKRCSPRTRYCSHPCALAATARRRRTGEDRSCKRCGSAFYVIRSRADIGEGVYCSLACHNAAQGDGKTDHVCKVCSGTFRWSPSRTASGRYNVTYCSLACRDADPDVLARLNRQNARQSRATPNGVERAGYALLDSTGVPYRAQEVFMDKFTPDAIVDEALLLVQFDGDYWHDRAGTSTESRILRRVALDRSQDVYAAACGWRVLRLWEGDLRSDPAGCLAQIREHLSRPLPPTL
jgi:very-short-patch-repair endonuclease